MLVNHSIKLSFSNFLLGHPFARQCNNGGTHGRVHENTDLLYRVHIHWVQFWTCISNLCQLLVLTLCCSHPNLLKTQHSAFVWGTHITEIILRHLSMVLSKFCEDIDCLVFAYEAVSSQNTNNLYSSPHLMEKKERKKNRVPLHA